MELVKIYLASRGIHPEPWPDDLAFHPSVSNFTTGKHHPAMLAAVRDKNGEVVAVHQTFLTQGGSKITGEGVKAKLFMGAVKGGAIRLAKTMKHLCLCEGIEDALSIIQCTGLPCWATGSAGNIPDLPETIREVVICADADPAGVRAAHKAAERYGNEGRTVRVALPPQGFKDFNAALMAGKEMAAL